MIGKTISCYEILEKLGEGGMGVVFKARDTKLNRIVGLKFLPSTITASDIDHARLLQEARAAAALNHPNICTIHTIEEVDGKPFIVMELVEGRTLRAIIKSEPPDLQTALAYATQIAEALHEAHAHGIIHRDIKSENIMVNSKNKIKVMDFGLAKLRDSLHLTKTSSTVGTAAYMAPELISGGEATAQSDIFSFGVVLYEMLMGKMPFRGTHAPALMYSIMNEEPEQMENATQPFPAKLKNIVKRALEKDPVRRYQSFADVLADLNTVEGSDDKISLEGNLSTDTAPSIKAPRKKTIALAVVTIVLLIAIGLAWSGKLNLSRYSFISSVPEERHLAVLPFTQIGGDNSKQSLCDGLVETMTSKLGQLQQFHGSLWVVPASEIRRNKTQSPDEARQSFGANLVVAGNLQLVGDLYRLTLNLIDAQSVRQLNSSVIDVKAKGLSTLQDLSITRLLDMLKLELNSQGRDLIQAGNTSNPLAYELYLQGVGYLQHYTDVPSLDLAISLFKGAIERDRQYALAYSGLGSAYWRKYEAIKENQWAILAGEEAEKAFELDSQLSEVNITLGMIHAGTGKTDEAQKDFQRALDVDASNAAAFGGLAKAFETKGMLVEAERTYNKAIELKPDYWGGYNDLGVFDFRHSRYDDAIEQFKHVLELTPDNDRGYSNLGGIYYMLKRWPEARTMLERSLSIKKSYRVCSNLGTLYYKEGEYAKSARMYETALQLNDKDYRVWGNLAAAYQWAPGERDKAPQTYKQAIALGEKQGEINKNDPQITSDLAGYYAMLGAQKNSLTLIGRTIKITPLDAQVMYRLGAAYEQLGDRENAFKWLSQALRDGYPLAEIEQEPELRSLCSDSRFQTMKNDATPSSTAMAH